MDVWQVVSQNIGYILAILGGIILWRTGMLQNMFTSSQQLLANRTIERDDCLRDKSNLKNQLDEAEREIRLLRRECMQRAEINEEDRKIIKELRDKYDK